jgi:hypothetical protein
MRQVTWCVIDEVNSGDWAIGGQRLTTEAVRQLAAGAARADGSPGLLEATAGLAADYLEGLPGRVSR